MKSLKNALWSGRVVAKPRRECAAIFLDTLIEAAAYRERSLQLAGDGAEAVEHKVFAHAVDPLAAGRQRAAHKVTAFPLTRAETPHDLNAGRHTWVQHTAQQYDTKKKNKNPQRFSSVFTRKHIHTHLALHVHDDHRVGAVAHHKVLRVFGQQDDVVDRDVGAGRRSQGFEGVAALGGLHVPHLMTNGSQR